MTGAFDDRFDAIEERLIVDPPARRGEYRERPDERLVHEALRIARAPDRVVARLTLAQPVNGDDEVARGEVDRAGLELDELLAEGLFLGRAKSRGGRARHDERAETLADGHELLAARGCGERAREVAREEPRKDLRVHGMSAEAGLLRLGRDIPREGGVLDRLGEVPEDERRDRDHVVRVDELVAVLQRLRDR